MGCLSLLLQSQAETLFLAPLAYLKCYPERLDDVHSQDHFHPQIKSSVWSTVDIGFAILTFLESLESKVVLPCTSQSMEEE